MPNPDSVPDVDLTSLSHHDALEYRHELIHALIRPEGEMDTLGEKGKADRQLYINQLAKVDLYLHENFGEPEGGNPI